MRGARWVVIGVLALGVIAAGCGGDDDEGAGTEAAPTATEEQPSGEPVATVEVVGTEFELDPANPEIEETGVVEFEFGNEGQVVHALEVEGPAEEFETEEIEPGGSATLRADLGEPGEYVWYCPVGNHREQGMEGTITVAGGGGTTDEGGDDEGGDDSGGGPGY